jgi:hypothetical protein
MREYTLIYVYAVWELVLYYVSINYWPHNNNLDESYGDVNGYSVALINLITSFNVETIINSIWLLINKTEPYNYALPVTLTG